MPPEPGAPGSAPADPPAYRFYADLATWWPLISPPEDYAEEAEFFASVLIGAGIPGREVLELGSGGGSNAVHLKAHFALTLVDLSAGMLAVSRRLNPDCTHHQGDLRTVRLGRRFDAVFVHDAIDYMTTEADLRLALETASAHVRPGGVALFAPDHITETYEPDSDCGGSDGADGRGARYLEWSGDPDPDDGCVVTEYAFLLRQADGTVEVIHESHRTGVFSRSCWLALLAETGFRPEVVIERTSEDRTPRELFLARRPVERLSRRPSA